jgi:hypothetical protein
VLATSVLGSVKEDTFRLDAVRTPALMVDAVRLDIATAGNVREDTLRLEAVISPALMVDAVRVEKVDIEPPAKLDKLILEKVATLPLTSFVSTTAVSRRRLNGRDPRVRRPAHPALTRGSVNWNPKSCIPATAKSS